MNGNMLNTSDPEATPSALTPEDGRYEEWEEVTKRISDLKNGIPSAMPEDAARMQEELTRLEERRKVLDETAARRI